MPINRDELNTNSVEFSDMSSGKQLPLVHPGHILREEFLTPMEMNSP